MKELEGIELTERMVEIIKEIDRIINNEAELIEDDEITEENLYHDIRYALNDKVANLIEEEILEIL